MRFPIKITDNFLLEPILRTFGVSAANSYVDLSDTAVAVEMGRWFDESVPLADIASLAPSDWPWWGGLGVKLAPRHGVGVVGSAEGVVTIGFKAPRPMKVVFFSPEVERLWISLEDPKGFLDALSAATGIPAGPAIAFWSGEPQ